MDQLLTCPSRAPFKAVEGRWGMAILLVSIGLAGGAVHLLLAHGSPSANMGSHVGDCELPRQTPHAT